MGGNLTDTPTMTGNPNTPEQPPEQLTLDRPYDLDDRATRLRAELEQLDTKKLQARTEALDTIGRRVSLVTEYSRLLDEAVAEARGYGATWQQVADAAGLVKSAAWERWAHRG